MADQRRAHRATLPIGTWKGTPLSPGERGCPAENHTKRKGCGAAPVAATCRGLSVALSESDKKANPSPGATALGFPGDLQEGQVVDIIHYRKHYGMAQPFGTIIACETNSTSNN